MLNKKHCRVILASGLMVSASMMFAGAAKAVESSGEVQGTVAAINLVTYTQPTTATALTPAGTTDMNFGSVAIQSNDFDGWTLTVASQNGSTLKNGAETIAYTGLTAVANGGAPTPNATLNVSSSAATIASPGDLQCAASGCFYSLNADVASTVGFSTGNYTDTLTFTLTAK